MRGPQNDKVTLMMHEAKISSKWRVTIPKEICRVLGIEHGDSVVFEVDETGVHLRPLRPSGVFAKYAGIWREGEGLTVEELTSSLRDTRGHSD